MKFIISVCCEPEPWNMCLLSVDDVRKILKAALREKNVKIIDHEIMPCSSTVVGYLGNHLKLLVKYSLNDNEGQRSFFVKTCSSDFLVELGIFEKERNFYQKLLNDFENTIGEITWCPKYYYSTDRFLVLEDLSETGYKMVDSCGIFLDVEHMVAGLKALSRMHASSMIFEDKKMITLTSEYPSFFREILYDETVDGSCKKWILSQIQDLLIGIDLLDKYKDNEKKLIKEKFADEIMRIYPLSKQSRKYKNVLTHGDVWKNNWMFRYSEPGKVPKDGRLVDYQFSRYAPPAHDVMHFLYAASNKKDRDSHEHFFLDIYYESLGKEFEALGKNVEDEMTRDEFMESCSVYREVALIQSLLSIHYILGPVTLDAANRRRDEYMKALFLKETYNQAVPDLMCDLINNYIIDT